MSTDEKQELCAVSADMLSYGANLTLEGKPPTYVYKEVEDFLPDWVERYDKSKRQVAQAMVAQYLEPPTTSSNPFTAGAENVRYKDNLKTFSKLSGRRRQAFIDSCIKNL